MKKPLTHDSKTGITQYWHWDPETEISTVTSEQDTSFLLDVNRELRNEQSKHHFEENEEMGTHIAHIPMTIYMDLVKKGITKDQVEFKKWLNDPANAYFRTHPGTI